MTNLRRTRIQQTRVKLILDCALEVFASYGFHGATIDRIAAKSDLSKPNVLYYFKSKEHIYQALLERTLEGWIDPLLAIDPDGDPIAELTKYVSQKMDMSFDHPLASRLFAMEVLHGAQQLKASMSGALKVAVDHKAEVIRGWVEHGSIKSVDPYHLIFSIWSVTQHYADFGVQIEILLGAPPDRDVAKAAVLNILLRGLKK